MRQYYQLTHLDSLVFNVAQKVVDIFPPFDARTEFEASKQGRPTTRLDFIPELQRTDVTVDGNRDARKRHSGWDDFLRQPIIEAF